MNRKLIFISGSILGLLVIVITLVITQIPLGLSVGYDIVVQDDYAFVSDNEGVDIINIANPSKPNKVSEFNSPDGAFGLLINNDNLYIASDSDGLEIVDISDPENTELKGSFNDGGSIIDVAVEGSFAYILKDYNQLEVLDISNPSEISKIGTYDDGGSYRRILVKDGVGYLADAESGLKILNLTNPTSPVQIRRIPNTYAAIDIYFQGDFLFLGCHGNGVVILDLTNPLTPVKVGSFTKSGGEAYGVTGNRTHLYVADLQLGVYLLNISDPTHPVELTHNSHAAPHGISFDGRYIYLADQDRKIIILSPDLSLLYTGYPLPGYVVPTLLLGILVIILTRRETE